MVDAKRRKGIPVYSGFVAYFPDAILAVAELSRIGNDQHNPGQPLHWSREKSADHQDCLMRHTIDDARGEVVDTDNVLHKTKVAWRAMADLQIALEKPTRNRRSQMTLGELVTEDRARAERNAAPFIGEGIKVPALLDENSKSQKFAPCESGLWSSLSTREKCQYIIRLNKDWKGDMT